MCILWHVSEHVRVLSRWYFIHWGCGATLWCVVARQRLSVAINSWLHTVHSWQLLIYIAQERHRGTVLPYGTDVVIYGVWYDGARHVACAQGPQQGIPCPKAGPKAKRAHAKAMRQSVRPTFQPLTCHPSAWCRCGGGQYESGGVGIEGATGQVQRALRDLRVWAVIPVTGRVASRQSSSGCAIARHRPHSLWVAPWRAQSALLQPQNGACAWHSPVATSMMLGAWVRRAPACRAV